MRALITGSGGQDGSYLCDSLREDGWEICEITRHAVFQNGMKKKPIDIRDTAAMGAIIDEFQPHQIYHLAAHHHSAEQIDYDTIGTLRKSFQVHVDAFLGILEGVARYASKCRVFYAASSHVFGIPVDAPQTEETPFNPVCPYGVSKSTGIKIGQLFRKQHELFVCSGILYNHDSPRRANTFLIPGIVRQGLEIKRGEADAITVGKLDASVDWGYAPDYVDAMRRILEVDRADDYVVASGRLHSVNDVVKTVIEKLQLPGSTMINEDKSRLVKSKPQVPLVGDSRKLTALTGWRPTIGFDDMIGKIIDARLADA